MSIYFDDKKLVVIPSTKSISFDLPTEVKKIPEHEIKFIIGCNESLAECEIKNEISKLLFKYKHEHQKQ